MSIMKIFICKRTMNKLLIAMKMKDIFLLNYMNKRKSTYYLINSFYQKHRLKTLLATIQSMKQRLLENNQAIYFKWIIRRG